MREAAVWIAGEIIADAVRFDGQVPSAAFCSTPSRIATQHRPRRLPTDRQERAARRGTDLPGVMKKRPIHLGFTASGGGRGTVPT